MDRGRGILREVGTEVGTKVGTKVGMEVGMEVGTSQVGYKRSNKSSSRLTELKTTEELELFLEFVNHKRQPDLRWISPFGLLTGCTSVLDVA